MLSISCRRSICLGFIVQLVVQHVVQQVASTSKQVEHGLIHASCCVRAESTLESAAAHDELTQSTEDAATALLMSPSNVSSSCCGDAPPPSKPVAMVQPRKVHGVRVLPSPTSSRRLTPLSKPLHRLARSPAIRAPRTTPAPDDPPPPPGARRWAAGRRLTNPGDDQRASCDHQRRHRYARYARRPTTHHGSVVDDESTTSNWQCRVGLSSSGADSATAAWSSVGQLAAVAEAGPPDPLQTADDGDTTAHEALLMTKKKDAEIAALLRHIRLSGGVSRDVGSNHVRSRPAFNECVIERINFERSLGYFP